MKTLLLFILKPFTWIIQNIFSFIIRTIFIIAILGIGGYFAMIKLAPEYKSEVDQYISDFTNGGGDEIVGIVNENIDKIIDTVKDGTKPKITAYLNDNKDSNIAMVITGGDNENITVFKNNDSGNEYIDKLVIKSNNGNQYLVLVDKTGLPIEVVSGNNKISYKNYDIKNSRVDVIIDINGKIEEKKSVKINLDKKTSFFQIIPTVNAAEGDYYIGTVGQVWSIISCGGGIGMTVISGGAASPMLYLSCGVFLTRVVTSNMDIGSCQGDVMECAKDAVIAVITEKPTEYTHETDEVKNFGGDNESNPEVILDLNPSENKIITDGKYSNPINYSRKNNGLTEKTTGTITATFNDGKGTCSIIMNSDISGIPNTPAGTNLPSGVSMPSIKIAASLKSKKCSGQINKVPGSFSLTGKMESTMNISGQSTTQNDNFSIVGQIVGSKMTGVISVPNNTDINF